jgi:3'-phosphoadenosine 5'-phosphosulfate sulfotransferase (PAPS reductase)/FAD synthetase
MVEIQGAAGLRKLPDGTDVDQLRERARMQLHFFSDLGEQERLLCWFSCGATSAVATKLALDELRDRMKCEVLYCDTGSEHPDNERFLRECEEWFGVAITKLKHPEYDSVDEVIERNRFLNGPRGAACTKLLKIEVRKNYQRAESDIQVFGFDAGEMDRAFDFKEAWPEVRAKLPLIDRNMRKADCHALLREVGIELPQMYALGYRNNNCLGCVKGGKGYWNKIREDFPEVFKRRAKQEREIGHSCIKGCFLDELQPGAGRYEAEPDIACEGVCVQVKEQVSACSF